MRVLSSLNQTLHECMDTDDRVHFLGEDILDPYGGAFKVARGLSTAFPDRVHTTPVSEAGIVGAGVGMALRGLLPVVEIMFGDFITLAADQLINHAAKLRWMSNEQVQVPLVVRTPMGGHRGYGPTHSQTLERMYLGVPGLWVVAASALVDPGQLLSTSILLDPDPVLFIEHKLLYQQELTPLGQLKEFVGELSSDRYPTAKLRIKGAPAPQITVAAYGYSAELARQAMVELAYQYEIFSEMILFSQLSPLPTGFLLDSLSTTTRLLTVEEGVHTHGWGAEVVAAAQERAAGPFLAKRVAARDMPVPAAGPLEKFVLPSTRRIVSSARALLEV
jgi:pyruvate/2-oxoglutarate/acetoin dehydrogenase E1 component